MLRMLKNEKQYYFDGNKENVGSNESDESKFFYTQTTM